MAEASSSPPAVEAPLVVEHEGLTWLRTDVRRGPDLVDGKAWIEAFQRRLAVVQESDGAQAGRPRMLSRQTASCGDAPQFWGKAGDAPLPVRNEVLKQMQSEYQDASRGPGRKVRLPTGQDVIFWFNVGAAAALGKPPRERVNVTAAYCPHQQLCLNAGELKDIEDISGTRHCMVRCSRHNKMFDLRTGESPGNSEVLRIYPCRFVHDHWYVGIGAEEWAAHTRHSVARDMCPDTSLQSGDVDILKTATHGASNMDVGDLIGNEAEMDVDMVSMESLTKRVRTEPTPLRVLTHQSTI